MLAVAGAGGGGGGGGCAPCGGNSPDTGGAGGAGGVNGTAAFGAGGITGGSGTSSGTAGGTVGAADGGGGGGGAGGGSSSGDTVTNGSGVNAGNNTDPDYAGNAGAGGAGAIPFGSNALGGNPGLVVIIEQVVIDFDGDGVLNADDVCSGTVIPEPNVPTVKLGVNRWALVDGDGTFDTTAPKGKGPQRSYTISDTGGCSAEQIIDATGAGKGHRKFGASISLMDDWVALINP